MIIAKEKKKKNIIEYLLYMWQLEDMIRGFDFDMDKINKYIISQFDVDDKTRAEMKQWYESLVETMKNEGVEKKGHIQVLESIVRELRDLHIRLLRSPFHQDYQKLFSETMPYLIEYQQKSNDKAKSVIDQALEVMYGIWMLRIKKHSISQATQEAVKKISEFLSLLALKYHKLENDEDFQL